MGLRWGELGRHHIRGLFHTSPRDWPIVESWDATAEALQGISLERLRTHGRSVWDIAQRMNRVLAGRELFSDSLLDEGWLTRIFNSAGLDPAFTIRRMDAEVLILELAKLRGLDAGNYERARLKAKRLAPRIHRAGADARHLAAFRTEVAHTPANLS